MPQDAPLLSSGQGNRLLHMKSFFKAHKPLGMEINNIQDRQDVLHCLLLFHGSFICRSFFPIAVDISEDPNCPPKHREARAEKLCFVLFVKQVWEQRKHQETAQIREMCLSPTSALVTSVTSISSPGTAPLMAAEPEQCQMAPESPSLFILVFFLRHVCQKPLKDSDQRWLYLDSWGGSSHCGYLKQKHHQDTSTS